MSKGWQKGLLDCGGDPEICKYQSWNAWCVKTMKTLYRLNPLTMSDGMLFIRI